MFEIILMIVAVAMPYTIFGEETAAVLMAVLGLTYIVSRKKIMIPKDKISALLALLAVSALVSMMCISRSFSGLWRMILFFDLPIYYVVFKNFKLDDEKKLICYRSVLYSSSLIAVYSILVHGIYYSVRIYGNIGYANTYALLLLCILLYGHKYEKNMLDKLCIIILMTAVFFTGSRITFILAALILAVTFIRKHKQGIEFENYPEIPLGVLAFISYIVFAKLKFAGFLVMPLIAIFLYAVKDAVAKIKHKKIICLIAAIAGVVCIIALNTNSFARIKNISLNNGSLQERFVMYEDGIKAVAAKPLGHGLGTYAVLHNYECSADYPVKYVHNSVIQCGYEMGIIEIVIFILFMISALINCKDRTNRIILSCLFMSSMLNFDFSYVSVIIAAMLAVSENKSKLAVIKNGGVCKAVFSVIIAVFLVVTVNEVIISATTFAMNRESTAGYDILTKWSGLINYDERIYNNIAGMNQLKYLQDENPNHLKNSISYLKKSSDIFDKDGRVKWNLAYCYKKTGDYKSYMNEMDKASDYYLFNKDYYEEYEKGLQECYKATNDNIFKNKITEINKRKSSAHKILNKRVIYMKNQI